ncbi:MAG: hypothetical protein RSF68_01820 [Myroides sp.]
MPTNYENDFATYEYKDQLLYVNYKERLYIDFEAACVIVDDRLKFQSYQSCAIVCNVSHVGDVDADAREYLATYGSNLAKAVAMYSTTHTMRNLADHFVTINKPMVPTKIFDNLPEAEKFAKIYV